VVSFEPDRWGITDSGAAMIHEAAIAFMAGRTTSIGVAVSNAGETNQVWLALRRANAVRDRLIQEGVAATKIPLGACSGESSHGPTAPGSGYLAVFPL
jgi:outer membrane protein OmpA-like peptidoglycan-associated protein